MPEANPSRAPFDSRSVEIRRTRWIVLVLNWAVAAAKLVYGIVAHSASVTADGLHSLSDGANNIVGLVATNYASRPSDSEHPYGHQKIETLISMVVAGVLLVMSYEVIREAFGRFLHPVRVEVTPWGFVVLAATLAVNAAVYLYEHRMGLRHQSDFLLADAIHTRSDIFVSCIVLATLVGIKTGFQALDLFTAIFIAIVILRSAWDIVWSASRVLIDTRVIPPESIERQVLGIPGVLRCYNIRSRGRADSVFIDLYASVDKSLSIEEAHRISQEIEALLGRSIPGVAEVIVHMEPE
ncbi:MAG: cation diffusion facilitator family transporter [bacterium]